MDPRLAGLLGAAAGCGQISGLTFRLTCSTGSGDQRAERRYTTYTGGTHQFEGSFKITSMGGSRISLKQTFRDGSGAGPFFLLAVEKGGRLYAVHGGETIATGATVGTSVRVNSVNQVGSTHKVYINGSQKDSVPSPDGSYYDKFGSYRTASGQGPITVEWSGIGFWHKRPRRRPRVTPGAPPRLRGRPRPTAAARS